MKRLYFLMIPALILASCGEKKGNDLVSLKKERSELDAKIKALEAGKKDSGKVVPVAVTVMKPTTFKGNIEVQSVVEGDENVLASSQAGGVVKSILVHAGQHVSAGQVLAVLDAAAQEQQIAAAKAQLELAKTLYEKQQALWNQNIGTEVQLLQAKTQYESAQKNVGAMQSMRNMGKIVAPISGTVQTVDLKVGSTVMPGLSGIQIVNNSKLKASAMLGENYLGKVKAGDPVMIALPTVNDSVRATVSFVGESVESLSRAFKVQVQLPNSPKLHPNMSCIMKIANYTNSSAMVVPISVIQKTSEGAMVYIADGNKAKAVSVTTGRTSNGNVEVLSGLNEGDKVITTGYEEIENGQSIAIQ
jgi:membrane fusion protein (multidrug efflux system)